MIPACYRVVSVDNNMSYKVIFNDRWIGTNNASSSWGVVFSTIFEISFGSWPNLFFMRRKTQNGGGFVCKSEHLDTNNLNQRFPSKWRPLISYDEITSCSWVFYLRTLHISENGCCNKGHELLSNVPWKNEAMFCWENERQKRPLLAELKQLQYNLFAPLPPIHQFPTKN